MNLDSSVDARVVTNVDGQTDVQTDVWMDRKTVPYIVLCLTQEGQKGQSYHLDRRVHSSECSH